MRSTTLLLTVWLLTWSLASPSFAQTDWALAMQPDENILAALEGKRAEDAPGASEATAVILLQEHAFDVLPGSHRHVRNVVFQVNVPEDVGDELLAPYLAATGTVDQAAAFVIRGGTLERLEKDAVEIVPGDGHVLRHRLRLKTPPLQRGDIVGWSTISTIERVLYNAVLPATDRVPVVTASLRLQDQGLHTYRIEGRALGSLDVKGLEQVNGRDAKWHAQAHHIAATPDLSADGPFAADTPLILVTESEEYGALGGNEWIPTLAWSRVALWLSGLKELAIGKMVAAYGKAPAITRGATSVSDQEEAIFTYVRDQLGALEGDAYQRFGFRSADEIFASGKATEMEKAMLMVTMLEASGLEGELAAVRPGSWGPLEGDLQSFVQFDHVAVRCGGEQARFYAPQVADSPVGGLPKAWGKAAVVSPKPGFTQEAYRVSSQVQGEALSDIRSLFVELQAAAVKEGWVRIEHAR